MERTTLSKHKYYLNRGRLVNPTSKEKKGFLTMSNLKKDTLTSVDVNNNELGREELYAMNTTGNEVIKQVYIDKLKPNKNHPFKTYTGKRLEKLTNSIKISGILQPPVVRAIDDDEYEIISGHNRKNAAELAGLEEILVIIREDLKDKDDETTLLVNEANIVQRSFQDWEHSEKAKSLYQYNEAIKRQGYRTDKKSETPGQNDQKFNARKTTADVYGVDENVVKRYIQVHGLIDPLMERLDEKEFGLSPAINLSYIPDKIQTLISSILDEDKERKIYQITGKNSEKLRKSFEDDKNDLTEEAKAYVINKIKSIITKSPDIPETSSVTIKIKKDKYEQLFRNGQKADEIENEIITALKFYREKNTDDNQ